MLITSLVPLFVIVGFAALIVVILIIFRGKPVAREADGAARIHYTRLPGKGLRREGFVALTRTWCTLWIADDHLLSVDNHLFSEDYKRFYFRDIQAIIMAKTRRGAVWNAILGTMVALWLLIMFRQNSMEGRIAWVVVAAIFLVLLLINVLRGTTCRCQLITAVHQETLPSLNRLTTANKVLDILRQRIRQAQRDLNVPDTF